MAHLTPAAVGGSGAPAPVLEDTDDFWDSNSVVTDIDADKDFRFPVPVVPTPVPAAAATRAFIRIWHNDKELTLTLDYVNGLEMEELEFAIRGLTAQFLTPKPAPGSMGPRPRKRFYNVSICCGPNVSSIDNAFKRRFGNPEKKWRLRMGPGGGHDGFIRKWGKVEVSFILY